jgi:hypothetical protein
LEKFGQISGWLGWILKNLGLALKKQISARVQARPALGCGQCTRQNARTRAGEASTQFPNALRSAAQSCASAFSKTMLGRKAIRPSQVEYRL